MKTEAQKLPSSTGQHPMSRSKVRNDVQEKGTRTADEVRSGASEADPAGRGETLDVVRAQDVYARTEQAARPSAGPAIETSEEATQLLAKVTGQIRGNAEQALQAQGRSVSAHLVEPLGHK